jgi:hypothetical protein
MLCITSCSIFHESKKHTFEIIELDEYYHGKGAIVPVTYDLEVITALTKRITPTLAQIKMAEEILKDDLFSFNRSCIIDWQHDGKWYKNQNDFFWTVMKDERKELEICYRQYTGFINNNGDTLIAITLLNFYSDEGRKVFQEWRDKEYYFVYGGYLSNPGIKIHIIDINKLEIVKKGTDIILGF